MTFAWRVCLGSHSTIESGEGTAGRRPGRSAHDRFYDSTESAFLFFHMKADSTRARQEFIARERISGENELEGFTMS